MKVDVLLIGQGLAGTLLSYQLRQRGLSVLVLDQPQLTASSRIAAGLYNPITGRQMVKTWWADRLFPLVEQAYQALEELTGQRFLHPMPLYRPFVSIAEKNDWHGRWSDPAYAPYIERIEDGPIHSPQLINPFGGLMLRQTGWLDIPLLLDSWRAYLQQQGAFRADAFAEEELELLPQGVRYRDVEADKLVYCTGTAQLQSRYWQWLPLRPVKGDVLLLQTGEEFPFIPNRGVFMVPLGGGRYRAGSTYNHQDLSLEPDPRGRAEIEEKLGALVAMPWQVLEQQVGIRPATKDRRPVLGAHPELPGLYVFNGLGTKGVSLAPYCAELLADHLKNGTELATEISIKRFYSLY
ncbi:NAD(P)/FAD-dependent oxidoreductase [Cesiribacter andamanensis]|uniref:Glycine oxidase n=1 Tax=Cesiribacter andamanensis AMV16 TaxID=1279009 RepID=M7N7G7_9BACT|nr:FAD-dependent oxidoreductase [Cesiribacter andamanensis]EMR04553.1 Glycine oxidase [Cesiribacter andamanensis AMV16]